MSIITEVGKELLPSLRDSLKNGINAARTSKRKKRHLFILKAMGDDQSDNLIKDISNTSFDLPTIEHRLLMAQVGEAAGLHGRELQAQYYFGSPRYDESVFKRQRRLGIPSTNDPRRLEKLESILNEMVDDKKLKFLPPDRWMVVV